MAVTMTLGGVSLGANFPLYSSSFQYVRPDDQGPAIKRVQITLAGFLEGTSHSAVLTAFNAVRALVGSGDTTFTYTDGAVTVHNSKQVWIGGYNEPVDTEHGRCRVGDYSIELYYFEDAAETNKAITASYNGYTFPKTPKWGRSIKPNRDRPGGTQRGSTATVTISGTVFGTDSADTITKALALQAALSADGLLTYGSFSQNMYVEDVSVDPVVPSNWINYTATFIYYTSEIIELKRRTRISRVHHFPVVTEEPYCNRRQIDLLNRSGQFLTYTLSVKSESISTSRTILAGEIAAMMSPGGTEWPGGEEEWDWENFEVSISVTKFHSTPVIENMTGTGE